MKYQCVVSATVLLTGAVLWAANDAVPSEPFEVRGGKVAFDVSTNVPALSVHGESSAMRASLQMQRAAENLVVERIEASLAPATLATGMGLRDEHMRKYIFTTQDGQVPELRFVAEKQVCPKTARGGEIACQLTGDLTIRGVTKPFSIALKVKEEGRGGFRAIGDSLVKLSDFGIPAPSQFGVKTGEEVKLHFDFATKKTVETSSIGGTR